MVYTWGTKLQVNTEYGVDEHYAYKKGEYGIVRHLRLETSQAIDPKYLPTEAQIAQKVIQTFSQKGATVLYLAVSSERQMTGGYVSHYWKTFTLEECHFRGSPFTGLEWIAIIATITIAGILLSLAYTGIWSVVTVMEEAKKLGAPIAIGTGLILIIIVFVVILLILGVGFQAKGKRGMVKAGK